MKAKFIFCYLVFTMCLKTVVLETVALSPNQSLRREKRFIVSAIIDGLIKGVRFIDAVNRIFGLNDTIFGLVVKSLAQIDVSVSSKVYKKFEDLLEEREDKLTEKQKERAHAMMDALECNIGNSTCGATFLMGSFVSTTFFTMTVTYFTC